MYSVCLIYVKNVCEMNECVSACQSIPYLIYVMKQHSSPRPSTVRSMVIRCHRLAVSSAFTYMGRRITFLLLRTSATRTTLTSPRITLIIRPNDQYVGSSISSITRTIWFSRKLGSVVARTTIARNQMSADISIGK